MGIKTLIADVTADTSDLASNCITPAKIASCAGLTFAGVLTGSATSGYVSLVTVTSAVTFYLGIVQVTAAGTSGTVTICDSAGTALVEAINCSAAAATYMNSSAAATAKVVEIAAGSSLSALYSTGTATANFRAKYFASCIATPS